MNRSAKFSTAPARLRKRDIPQAWDLFALDERASEKDDDSESQASAPSLSRRPSVASSFDSELTDFNFFDPTERKTDGGSWPRYRKQRTSDKGSMSLFEVAEALGSADDFNDVTDHLNDLASLVAAEEKDDFAADCTDSSVSIESFVDAVFHGITPSQAAASASASAASFTGVKSDFAGADAMLAAAPPAPAPSKPAASKHHQRATANDLALLEAMKADEAAAEAATIERRRAMSGSPSFAEIAGELDDASPLGDQDGDDVFAMLTSMDLPPTPGISSYHGTNAYPPYAYAASPGYPPEGPYDSFGSAYSAYSGGGCYSDGYEHAPVAYDAPITYDHSHAYDYPADTHAFDPASCHDAPPGFGAQLSPSSADQLSGHFDLALGMPFGASPQHPQSHAERRNPPSSQGGGRGRSRGGASHRRTGSGGSSSNEVLPGPPPASIPHHLHVAAAAAAPPHASAGTMDLEALPAGLAPGAAPSHQQQQASALTAGAPPPPASAATPAAAAPPAAAPPAASAAPSVGSTNLNPNRNGAERKEWSVQEDDIIRQSVAQYGCKWRKIAAQLPGRSDDAVRNRWNRLKEMGVSSEGTAGVVATGGTPALTSSSEAAGAAAAAGSSSTLPMPAGTPATDAASKPLGPATGAAAPKPKVEKEKPERVSWTKAEDDTILKGVSEMGHKWNKIAERLPGRTDHAIRNRFHRLQTLLEDRQRQQQRTLAPALPLPMPIQSSAAAIGAAGGVGVSDGLTPGGGERGGFATPQSSSGSPAAATAQ